VGSAPDIVPPSGGSRWRRGFLAGSWGCGCRRRTRRRCVMRRIVVTGRVGGRRVDRRKWVGGVSGSGLCPARGKMGKERVESGSLRGRGERTLGPGMGLSPLALRFARRGFDRRRSRPRGRRPIRCGIAGRKMDAWPKPVVCLQAKLRPIRVLTHTTPSCDNPKTPKCSA